MRILIAEGDPVPRIILQAAVAQFGRDCLVAENGAQPWDVFQDSEEELFAQARRDPLTQLRTNERT